MAGDPGPSSGYDDLVLPADASPVVGSQSSSVAPGSISAQNGTIDPYPGGSDPLGRGQSDKPEGTGEKVPVGFDDRAGVLTIAPGNYQSDTPWPHPNSAGQVQPEPPQVGGTYEAGSYSGQPGMGNEGGYRGYEFRVDDMVDSGIGEGLGVLPHPYNEGELGVG